MSHKGTTMGCVRAVKTHGKCATAASSSSTGFAATTRQQVNALWQVQKIAIGNVQEGVWHEPTNLGN